MPDILTSRYAPTHRYPGYRHRPAHVGHDLSAHHTRAAYGAAPTRRGRAFVAGGPADFGVHAAVAARLVVVAQRGAGGVELRRILPAALRGVVSAAWRRSGHDRGLADVLGHRAVVVGAGGSSAHPVDRLGGDGGVWFGDRAGAGLRSHGCDRRCRGICGRCNAQRRDGAAAPLGFAGETDDVGGLAADDGRPDDSAVRIPRGPAARALVAQRDGLSVPRFDYDGTCVCVLVSRYRTPVAVVGDAARCADADRCDSAGRGIQRRAHERIADRGRRADLRCGCSRIDGTRRRRTVRPSPCRAWNARRWCRTRRPRRVRR